MLWDMKNLEGKAQTRDIVEAAKAWVPAMKEEGADIVIALSHSGIDGTSASDRMENASLYVAGVDGIDAIFTGHQHLVFPGPKSWDGIKAADPVKGTLQGKPAVMAGFWGSHLGLIDLLLEKDGKSWKIVDFTAEARPIYHRDDKKKVIADVADKKEVVEATKTEHEATLAYVRTPVGKTSAPLYSYFALVADDPSVQIVNQAQSWYIKDMLKDTAVQGSAGAFGGRALQGRRTQRRGLLHRRPGRRHRHQERRRPLSLSQHGAGGGHQRRAGEELAGNVGRHVQPDPAGRQGCGTPEPELSHPTISTSSTASPTRSTCPSRAASTTTASWRTWMRTASKA